MTTLDILKKTRAARSSLAALDETAKNRILLAMAEALMAAEDDILAENDADMTAARGHINDVMLDRLRLDHDRLAGMARESAPSPPCPTTPAAFSRRCAVPTALWCVKCRCRWVWCPLSTRAAPTSPPTRRRWR